MNRFCYFSKIYCINRASRTDRWEKMQQQFASLGLEVQRFNAIEGGEKGCMQSHIAVIKDAWRNQHKRILILEDDAEFLVTDMEYYAKVFQSMPPLWHLLYLGANPTEKLKRKSEYLFQAKGLLTGHAYAVNHSIYTQILSDARLSKIKVIDTYYLVKIQPRGKSYITSEFCVNQRPDYSDIQNYPVDYTDIKDKFIKFTQ